MQGRKPIDMKARAHSCVYDRIANIVFVSLLLCLSSIAFAAQLNGVIHDDEGQPLADIQVALFAYETPDFSGQHILSAAATDEEGTFSLQTSQMAPALLLVTGDSGTGRVRVSAEDIGAPFSITYPVRTTILLLHDNDLHFNFNYLDAFRARLSTYRAEHPNAFLLNAGDVFIRHPDRWPFPGEEGYFGLACYMITTMNELGYDAMAVGNHEIDYINDATKRALEMATFPLLGANVKSDTDNLPPFEPYTVLITEERYSVAVLGLSTGNFTRKKVRCDVPIETAQAYAHLASGYDVLVALTHIGNRNDRLLAESLDGLDVIIGGHTHGLLETAEDIGGVLFARAGGAPGAHPVDETLPKYLGVVSVVLENGRVVEKKGHVETITGTDFEVMSGEKLRLFPE